MIPLTVPELGDEENAAVLRVLRSGMLVQGKEVLAFEAALANLVGRAHAIAVVNGTAALELALRALGVGPGDEVICPALTWPSPAHAVRVLGAVPVLVDVDPDEWNLTPATLAAALGARTRAVIAIEQFGNPARHTALRQACGEVPLIVDAACSLGSSYQGMPCGAHGVIACTSFHPRKVITTGEGGACLTDDDALAEQLRALRNHGQAEPGRFVCASGNYRMTELSAAVGSAQLPRLRAICDGRRTRAKQIMEALPWLSFQRAPAGGIDNRQTLGVLVGERGQGIAERERVVAALIARGVAAGKLSFALHTLPQFQLEARAAEAAGRSLMHALDIAERGLCVPLFPSMSDAQVVAVTEALRSVTGENRA
jgi:perosamine synthetase